MHDKMQRIIDETSVGEQNTITTPFHMLTELILFQNVAHELVDLELNGIIRIDERRREKYTGRNLIDQVRFTRLK